MDTLFEKFIQKSGLTVFSFDRGPTLREIGQKAIEHKVISLVLNGRLHNHQKYYCNLVLDLSITNLLPHSFKEELSFLFAANIISTWPFALPSPADRSVQGCLDRRREGFFIFPKEKEINLF